ncbi:unnamed protein product [Cuscuta campestris]|uniref:Uncharacterized protein n=1 Tax=Cuscuta campestris TaxID=132261 RepID=A0A484LBF8_9ASTE|nr:unnamed protein product [Cuscuta campestris]
MVGYQKRGSGADEKSQRQVDPQDIKKVENYAKAINMLYCAVNPDDNRKISCCSTAKEMWDKLEVTCEGTDQVREAKIDFLTQEDLVRKILRSLTSEWRSKADAIYESIGTSNVTIDGLRGRKKKLRMALCAMGVVKSGTSRTNAQEAEGMPITSKSKEHTSLRGGDSGDESSEQEEDEEANLCLIAQEEEESANEKNQEVIQKPNSGMLTVGLGGIPKRVPLVWFVDPDSRIMPPSDGRYYPSMGGQRKRSRTGKNAASSLAPPPPAHQYLDGSFLWFNDRAEATRFSEKFEHREILPPRFSTARFIHDSIPREARVILKRGNCLDLLYIKKAHYHPFLVRAFYSNLKKDEDGALISNVNGVDIYLNEENIQILTGLRRDGQDLGLYVGEEGARFNETALLEETRKFNHTTLSQEDTKTIHAMIHKANLNWCKFVMTHMFTATSDNRPLPYALLVMAILEEYNIKTDVGPKIKGTKHWEIDESSFHSGTDETPFRQPRPRRQPRATASTATTSTNPSLAEQMAALTATLSRIDTNVSKTEHNVNTLSRELHGYFDFVNYPYAQLVPYVPPPNFGGEQSGTQNVGRDDEVDDEEEEEEEEEEAEDDDEDEDDEEEDIDSDQLLNDLSPDF